MAPSPHAQQQQHYMVANPYNKPAVVTYSKGGGGRHMVPSPYGQQQQAGYFRQDQPPSNVFAPHPMMAAPVPTFVNVYGESNPSPIRPEQQGGPPPGLQATIPPQGAQPQFPAAVVKYDPVVAQTVPQPAPVTSPIKFTINAVKKGENPAKKNLPVVVEMERQQPTVEEKSPVDESPVESPEISPVSSKSKKVRPKTKKKRRNQANGADASRENMFESTLEVRNTMQSLILAHVNRIEKTKLKNKSPVEANVSPTKQDSPKVVVTKSTKAKKNGENKKPVTIVVSKDKSTNSGKAKKSRPQDQPCLRDSHQKKNQQLSARENPTAHPENERPPGIKLDERPTKRSSTSLRPETKRGQADSDVEVLPSKRSTTSRPKTQRPVVIKLNKRPGKSSTTPRLEIQRSLNDDHPPKNSTNSRPETKRPLGPSLDDCPAQISTASRPESRRKPVVIRRVVVEDKKSSSTPLTKKFARRQQPDVEIDEPPSKKVQTRDDSTNPDDEAVSRSRSRDCDSRSRSREPRSRSRSREQQRRSNSRFLSRSRSGHYRRSSSSGRSWRRRSSSSRKKRDWRSRSSSQSWSRTRRSRSRKRRRRSRRMSSRSSSQSSPHTKQAKKTKRKLHRSTPNKKAKKSKTIKSQPVERWQPPNVDGEDFSGGEKVTDPTPAAAKFSKTSTAARKQSDGDNGPTFPFGSSKDNREDGDVVSVSQGPKPDSQANAVKTSTGRKQTDGDTAKKAD